MRARHRWVLTMVVLAAALLVTGGNGGIYRGGEALAHEFPFNVNFKCYVINQGEAPSETVELFDQFHQPERVTVREPQLLCTPAFKCRGDKYEDCDWSDVGFHLKCYNITPAGPPVNEEVTVRDQFFPEYGDSVKVQTAQYLCEGAIKEHVSPTVTETPRSK